MANSIVRTMARHITHISLSVIFLTGFFSSHLIKAQASASLDPSDLVVLADPQDPFYSLAEEISASEQAPLAPDLESALAYEPIFLLWIASPPSFSNEVFVQFGLTMKGRTSAISIGIITGSTIEQARDLWLRSGQMRSNGLYAVNAANESARIQQGRILEFRQGQIVTHPLTKPNLVESLRSADYLTFTGHGSGRYLRLDEETMLAAADIPSLHSPIVATGSCQTVQPWREDSISLEFIDQGAAGYSGFVFSPNEGYLLGEFDGLPFRYTWPGFPIGHVIQAQNHGTLQGFAYFPFHFLLGDPRIAFHAEPPYQIVSDEQKGNRRTLKLNNVPAGIIPIRIADGARYSFIRVPGNTAASEDDPFYNSRLQMVNIRNDKLILLVHAGGDLTIHLQRRAPWYWFPLDIVLDSLDHTFIFSQQSGGDLLSLGFAILPILYVIGQVIKRRFSQRQIFLAGAFGLVAVILEAVYVLIRLEHVTVISKTVVFSPLSLPATFLLASTGALLFLRAQSWFGRCISLSVLTFQSWAPMLFALLSVGVINILFSIPQLGTPLYSYSLGLLPVGTFLLSIIFSLPALQYVKTLLVKDHSVALSKKEVSAL
jgi:hypothetical protein